MMPADNDLFLGAFDEQHFMADGARVTVYNFAPLRPVVGRILNINPTD
jgi:hypothetical protein